MATETNETAAGGEPAAVVTPGPYDWDFYATHLWWLRWYRTPETWEALREDEHGQP